MPRKITIEDVREVFKREGCVLLSDIYLGIRKRIKYLCPNGHEVETTLFDFKQGYGRCYCLSSRKAWSKYNLAFKYPRVKYEWDYTMNYPLKPEDFTPGSNKKVWWKCDKCSLKHSYKQSIKKRMNRKQECPYFLGRRVGYGNDLYTNYKEMCDGEWDWELNDKWPSEYVPKSKIKVWWKCRKCNIHHSYELGIADKTKGRGCPYLYGKRVGFGNSVLDRFPDIAKEWDYEANKKGPGDYCFGSHKKVWFRHFCEDGSVHKWKAYIKNRTLGRTKCPYCARKDVSDISQEWLDSLNIFQEYREYKINLNTSFIKVDGFDPETNTVYEFLGDYWHGNPEIYLAGEINTRNKKSFGELYQETFRRFCLLEEAGYKVVYVWEKEFNKTPM